MARHLTDLYRQAKRIAMEAMDLADDGREALIARECDGQPDLEAEVRWMIAAMERSEVGLLTAPGESMSVDLSGQQAEVTAPRHYRLLRMLGEGGMGTVYLAERDDEGVTQRVALKFLLAAAEGSPVLLARFLRERRLLARLQHPGIARLLDSGVLADGKPFLAMEYVEGERIDRWCQERGLDLAARVALFLKVCAAVDYAHRNLVIHRDIKPANILVTADGEPKLLDFGIARLIERGEHPQDLTETRHQALTLAYASPEQIERRPLTTAVDVYALGVVLYELVSGRRPFQHLSSPLEMSNAIVGGEVVRPSRIGTDRDRHVPEDVDAVVMKAMRREAGERYASVGELVADLRRWQQQRPVRAMRGRRLYVLRRFVARNRWPMLAAVMAMLAILGGLGASLYALGQARAQQRLAAHRQAQLTRMVRFQRSMLSSVDIDAMGHAVVAAVRAQLPAAPHPGRVAGGVASTDIARQALDTYVVGHALRRLDHDFADAPRLGADLRESLAGVLLHIGSYRHAARELRQVLTVRHRTDPHDPRTWLSAQVALARALEAEGDHRGADTVLRAAAPVAAGLAVTDPRRIAVEAGRARLLAVRGHLQQALARQQALYRQLKPHLAADAPALVGLQRDLVTTLIGLGDRDRALALARPLVALERKARGADDPQTLDAMLTLARLLHYRYRYEQSLKLARQVAQVRAQRLGRDHPGTLAARQMVATDEVYLAQDPAAFARADADLASVIAARRRVLGPNHPDTIASMTVMVRLLAKQGRAATQPARRRAFYGRAIAMERRILDAHRRTLGADHPSTLMAEGSIASLLDAAGDYAPALAAAQRCLAGQRRVLGPQHPVVFATLNLIGDIDTDAGHLRAARKAYRQALDGRAKHLGPLDPHTIESASHLYRALALMHDHAAAQAVRTRYLAPVLAMNPAGLDAAMRSVRDEAIRMIGGRG